MGIKVRHNGQWVEFGTGTSSSGSGGGSGGSSDPVGTIVIWAGSAASIPTEYQLCDGGAAATSELEAITGTNVPDLTDRFVIGASNSTGDSTYPGLSPTASGGSANAVLISHSHTYDRATQRNVSDGGVHGAYVSSLTNDTTDITGQTSTGADSTSQTGTNANLPPYYALCYIIKHTASDSGGVGIGSTSKIIQGNTEAEVVDTNGNGHFKVTTEGTERLRVTPDGFVGIGSTMPAGVLDINSTTGDANVFIRTFSNNLGNTQVVFGDSDKNDSGKVQYNHPGDYMVFHTNSSEQVRITSNGSVGIGTTNPEGSQNSNPLFATKLDVFKSFVGGGDGSFVGRFYGLDTDVEETSVRFITKGTGGTTADLHNASDAYLMHGISNGDTKFVFGANGNVGIGTTNPNNAVDSTNTAKLAVGIVTCNELYVNGTQITGSGSGGSGGTVSSGTFTATAGSPSTLESYTYDSAELVFEYTVFVKNGSDYQTQKLLVMRDGTTVDSSQFAVMYSNNLLVQLDATISGSNLLLRATPETGVNGSTTYRIKREVI